ncbi:MAG: permease [Gemmataceae bacterium]
MIESLLLGVVLRIGQTLLEAAPTILFGFLTAAFLRVMVPPASIRNLFGGDGWSSLPRAWGIGMLLPVCSFGVIPVAQELRRAGVRPGTILAFALAAPLLNPISLLYGLTLPEPLILFSFVTASLMVSVLAGAIWSRWIDETAETLPETAEPMIRPGPKRLAAIACESAISASGPVLWYLAIGLLGIALLALVIPMGSLQRTMQHGDPWAPLMMAGVGFPAFVSPMRAMMINGAMFEHGNSIGAAYVMLVVGAGTNLGLTAWTAAICGWQRTALWFALVLSLAVGFGYAMENPLYLAHHQEDHTHAFDGFTAPFLSGSGTWSAVVEKWSDGKHWLDFEVVSLFTLAALVGAGVFLRAVGLVLLLRSWMQSETQAAANPRTWNLPLSPRMLAVVALLGFVAFGIVGAFVYYPEPDVVYKDIAYARTEAWSAVRLNRKEDALKYLRRWDDLTRKLEVGIFLRTGTLSEALRAKGDALREAIESVADHVKEDAWEAAKTNFDTTDQSYREYRTIAAIK